jgi:recombination associated protein RdgC
MPALSGSLSYARFFVEGETPDDFRERFMRAIRYRVIEPLNAADDALERSGWCVIGEPFDRELRYDNVFYNNFINLGFRTDRWVFPGAVVKARMREAETAYLEKKGRERLSKREKVELKEVVVRKLKQKLEPQVRAVDFSWSLEQGLVRFFGASPRVTASMMDVFDKTFHLKLLPEAPYTLAARTGVLTLAEREAAWDALEPTDLTDHADKDGKAA